MYQTPLHFQTHSTKKMKKKIRERQQNEYLFSSNDE